MSDTHSYEHIYKELGLVCGHLFTKKRVHIFHESGEFARIYSLTERLWSFLVVINNHNADIGS